MCNVLVEEEQPNGCLGRGCAGRKEWEDSSDSVTSSETYVEESIFSTGSGGENVSNSNGEGHWRVGEVEVGEEEGDGEQSRSKSTFPFLDLGKDGTQKGRVGERSGGSQRPATKDGRPSDSSTVQISGGAFTSNLCQSEAAKAVIDVECSLNENVAPKGMGRTHHLEAHLNAQDPNVEAQLEGTGEGLKCPIAFEHEGGSKSHVVDRLGSKATEGTLENNRYEEGATSLVNSITGAKPKGSEKAYAQTRSSVQLRLNVGTDGAKSPLFQGVEEASVKCRSNSPPRQRKKKGFEELGVSCPHLRRSVRLSEKQLRAGTLRQNREASPALSISDTDIRICNSRLCVTDSEEEPARLWADGRKVGLFCRGDEKEVVLEYGRMEARDTRILMESKLGDKEVLQ